MATTEQAQVTAKAADDEVVNTIVDSEAIDPVDYHIRAANNSQNNVFTRFSADSPLRCFVDGKSSVTGTDPAGNPLTCK